jgi:membrane protein
MDPSGVQVVQDIARTAAKPSAGFWASVIGIALALFGASGVFGQLQDALNTIWGVKAKPGAAIWDYIRVRFLSFAMVAGICFLLLVTLTVEAVLKGFSSYIEGALPGGAALAFTIYMTVDLCLVILLFAMMFKYLPDVRVPFRDVLVGAAMTAFLFLIGKWALGLYLGSGAAGSAYGAASSLVTLLIWIYYSSQILLFGAEFTQVYANRFGAGGKPSKHAVCIATTEKEISTPGEEPTPQMQAQVKAEAEAAAATKS